MPNQLELNQSFADTHDILNSISPYYNCFFPTCIFFSRIDTTYKSQCIFRIWMFFLCGMYRHPPSFLTINDIINYYFISNLILGKWRERIFLIEFPTIYRCLCGFCGKINSYRSRKFYKNYFILLTKYINQSNFNWREMKSFWVMLLLCKFIIGLRIKWVVIHTIMYDTLID